MNAHRWGPSRLALRIYLVMLLALAAVVAIIIFGRSRREPPPFSSSTARYVAETIARHRDDPQALRAELERADRDTSFEVTIYAADGLLLGSTTASPPPPVPPDQIDLGVRTTPGGRPEAVIRLSAGGDHAIVTRERPRPQGPDFTADIALVLLSLGIASLLLSRMIARPLGRIAEAARRFGHGDLSVRSGLVRQDELGELARTFDEMADRLTHLLRAQREMLAGISHELRTPIARIRVALDLASEGDGEAARESLGDIAADLAELEELVNDVLAMARLDVQAGAHGIPRLRTQPIDARDLARKAAARFAAAHPERPLELDLEGDVPLTVEADPNLLRRVIENLLENSHKYSGSGTPIRLRLAAQGAGAVFSVIDRGQGIAAADLPYVFEPFFRADRSRTRGTGGVGLGLALSRRVVEAHGGKIEITSEVDRGTTVTFTVPMVVREARNISQ